LRRLSLYLGDSISRIIALNRFRVAQNVYFPLRYEPDFNDELRKLMRTKQATQDIIASKAERRKAKVKRSNKI